MLALLRPATQTYHGNPCRRAGHTLRYKNGGMCVECQLQLARRWKDGNRERARENARRSNWKRQGIAPTRQRTAVCESCGHPPRSAKRPILAADHDHATGEFRGWLCDDCNVALGRLRDDPARIAALAVYLERSKCLH